MGKKIKFAGVVLVLIGYSFIFYNAWNTGNCWIYFLLGMSAFPWVWPIFKKIDKKTAAFLYRKWINKRSYTADIEQAHHDHCLICNKPFWGARWHGICHKCLIKKGEGE